MWLYMSGKILLPRHADESKLRTKHLSYNVKYILILPFLFLWDCSTIMRWNQGSWYKNLLTVSHARLVVTLHFFYKNQIILAEPQCSYCFYKFWAHLFLFCSSDNNNFWPCIRKWLVWRRNCIYNLKLKFVNITFCLLTESCSWRFYYKVSSELAHSVYSLLIFVSSFNWFDLFLTLEVFLGPCIQPGHCS